MYVSSYMPWIAPDGRILYVDAKHEMLLSEVVEVTRNGALGTATACAATRAAAESGDDAARRASKSKLLGFTPCGVVERGSSRRYNEIRWKSRTPLVAIDLDDVDDAVSLRATLAQAPEVAAVWVSASGRGVKLFVAVDTPGESPASYTRAWRSVCRWLQDGMSLSLDVDSAGSYWNGLQYLSHDASAYYCDEPRLLVVDEWPVPDLQRQVRPAPEPRDDDEQRAAKALDFIAAEPLGYDDWLRVGQSLYSLGSAGQTIWDAWSSRNSKYNPRDIEKKWPSFEGTTIHIGTLFWMARQRGWREESHAERLARQIVEAASAGDESWME